MIKSLQRHLVGGHSNRKTSWFSESERSVKQLFLAKKRELECLIIRDEFFNENLATVIERGAEQYQWIYGHKSDIGDPKHNKFFVSYLWDDIHSEDNFYHTIWRVIVKEVPCLSSFYCWRIIANGQVKGQNGDWHTDHGDKTILYFPLEWTSQWGGSTYFKVNELETEIEYKKNRIRLFNSDRYYTTDHVRPLITS